MAISTSTSSTSSTAVEQYKCKYGNVTVLQGDNYYQFYHSCKTALVVANSWGIVTGNEGIPHTAPRIADFEERRRRAINIISNSVSEQLVNKISSYVDEVNPHGMWEVLALENKVANDPVHRQSLRSQFSKETWDPKVETIQSYANRLETYRTKLAGTDSSLTEHDIRTALLESVPDDDVWRLGKHLCIQERRDLSSCISLLQTYQRDPSTPTAMASFAKGERGKAGRRGRGRGRGGRQGGGGTSKGYNGYKDKSKNQEIGEDQCLFCHKKGHRMNKCWKFKAAQAKVLAEVKEKETK
jgi:hypothetical protein